MRLESSAPPPPPPPPPPPSKDADKGMKPGLNRRVITTQELVANKSNLKKIRRQYLPVYARREELYDANAHNPHFFPILHADEALLNLLLTGDLVSISLEGLDHVTDAFFAYEAEKRKKLKFPALTKMRLDGCIHLTDQGIQWMIQIFDGIKEIWMSGCHNLTEKTLDLLLTTFPDIQEINMTGTNVAFVPASIASSQVDLCVNGCPLINTDTKRTEIQQASALSWFTHHKVVLWHGSSRFPYSIARYVSDGSLQQMETPLALFTAGDLHMFEFKGDMCISALGMVLTEGSVLVLPYNVEHEQDYVVSLLTALTARALALCPTCIVLLVASNEKKTTGGHNVEVLNTVKEILNCVQWNIKAMREKIVQCRSDLKHQRWKMEKLDFAGQRHYRKMSEKLQQLEEAAEHNIMTAVLEPNLKREPGSDRSSFLSSALERSDAILHLYKDIGGEFPRFHTTLQQLARLCVSAPVPEIVRLSQDAMADGVGSGLSSRACKRALDILSWKGHCIYMESEADDFCVLDPDWLVDVLNLVIQPETANGNPGLDVPSVKQGRPCWREKDLVAAIQSLPKTNNSVHKPEDVIALLVERGILLRVPCERSNDPTTESYAYVVYDKLTSDTAIPVAHHFWPPNLPSTDLQIDRFYEFTHGLPPGILAHFIRSCTEICRFTLLWQNGGIIQLGPVDCLLRCQNNWDGVMVLVIAVRAALPSSQRATDSTLECMWAALNMLTTIMDKTIMQFDVFVQVVIPCANCEPSRNVDTILFNSAVNMIPLTSGRMGNRLRCSGLCEERGEAEPYTKEALVGPDWSSVVPYHDWSVSQLCKNNVPVYSRCFLCDSCAESGMLCPQNGMNGDTARSCGCGTTVHVSQLSGVCHSCVLKLQHAESTIRPTLSSHNVMLGHGLHQKDTCKGNLYQVKSADAFLYTSLPLSPEGMSQLNIMLATVEHMHIGIANSCAPWEDNHSPLFLHEPSTGVIHAHQDAQQIHPPPGTLPKAKCRKGDNVSVRLTYPQGHYGYKIGSEVHAELVHNGDVVLSVLAPARSILVPYVQFADPKYTSRLGITVKGGFRYDLQGANIGLQRDETTIPENAMCEVKEDNCYKLVTLASCKDKDSASIGLPVGSHASEGSPLLVSMETGTQLQPNSEELWTLLRNIPLVPISKFCDEKSPPAWPPHPLLLEAHRASHTLRGPASVLSDLAHSHAKITEVMFQQGHTDLTGSACLLLPADVDIQNTATVSRAAILSSPLHLYPLCWNRGDIAEMLIMPPSYPISAESSVYWQGHLVDVPGIASSDPLSNHPLTPLLLMYHAVLAMEPQLNLPTERSHLWGEAPEKQRVNSWGHRAIQKIACTLALLQDSLSKVITDLTGDTLSTLAEIVHTSLVGDDGENIHGLSQHAPIFSPDNVVFLCHAHIACGTFQQANRLFDMDDYVNYNHFIRSLEITNQHLRSLPDDFLSFFPSLISLDVSHNKLTALPSGIEHCSRIKFLRAAYNRLTDLPPDLDAVQSTLTRLEVSSNPLRELPAVVLRLSKLRCLYILHCLLTCLPDGIGELQSLELLSMNSNLLRTLPVSFSRLQKLDTLNLNGKAWYTYRHGDIVFWDVFAKFEEEHNMNQWLVDKGTNAREVFDKADADGNGMLQGEEFDRLNGHLFTLFPRFCSQMTAAGTLTDGFPRRILQLTNLRYLSLQYQAFTAVPPEIARLTSLQDVNFSHNPLLLTLPSELGSLKLKRLELSECPSLHTPPREIRARGFVSVMAYLKRLQSGSVQCRRTKLMLVGLGGAGKTSLVKSLLASDQKGYVDPKDGITDGIDISSWSVGEGGEAITFNVWDFAGQTVYYNTHQFFLGSRAVYVLLWNMRLGHEHAGLDFWLSSIQVHAPKAPIFVVGSHADQVSKFELPMEEMQQRYPQIVGYHFVSSFTGQGIAELQDHLVRIAQAQKYMGESVPEVWLRLEQAVMRSRKDKSVISYKELQDKAANSGIFEESELSEAVVFLHELGALQHFKNAALRDRVVIDPQWIVDVMACVVSVKQSVIKEGRFHHADIHTVWKDYSSDLHEWLLRLTEEFDLTFPLPDQKLNLVPCLLPEKMPSFQWPKLQQGERETKMVYKFVYLPAGLFNRAQVRLYQFCDSSTIWKRGSLLRKNKHLALIMQKRDSELLVQVQGPRPENIVFLVHEVFEGLIAESFQGIQYDYYVPCPDCLTVSPKDPYMFAASIARKAKELKAPFLQCTNFFHTVTLTDLHAVMPPTSTQDYDMHLVNAVRGLTHLRKQLAQDVFISYCGDDIPSDGQQSKSVDPRRIRDDLLEAGYTCYFPDASHGMESQALALRDARVFVAIVSDTYVDDPGCCDTFMYAFRALRKPLILVITGSGQQWRKSKLGMLVSDEVFVNMQQPERYPHKITELHGMLKEKSGKQDGTKPQYPPCFISYCWQNSAEAVAKGSRKVEGALGSVDPRDIKKYLEGKGIKCWLDVERVGKGGLFEDIADGLQQASVMVTCVSDEYVASSNCVMEFRFATTILKIPTVLSVVGTGNSWRRSEVGLLSLQAPLTELNFQEQQEASFEKLYQIIKEKLPENTDSKKSQKEKESEVAENKNGDSSYQELFELAQRKFLRQVAEYADRDQQLYPRLVVVDFLHMIEDEQATKVARPGSSSSRVSLTHRENAVGKPDLSGGKDAGLGFKILCEYEEGWHAPCDALSAPPEFDESQLARFSPYLARITAILRHSSAAMTTTPSAMTTTPSTVETTGSGTINCVTGQHGQSFLKWLQELPQAALSDFGDIYNDLRREVIKADKERSMGKLARCQLPSGRTMWLCDEHRRTLPRVTVLSNSDGAVVAPSGDGHGKDVQAGMLVYIEPGAGVMEAAEEDDLEAEEDYVTDASHRGISEPKINPIDLADQLMKKAEIKPPKEDAQAKPSDTKNQPNITSKSQSSNMHEEKSRPKSGPGSSKKTRDENLATAGNSTTENGQTEKNARVKSSSSGKKIRTVNGEAQLRRAKSVLQPEDRQASAQLRLASQAAVDASFRKTSAVCSLM